VANKCNPAQLTTTIKMRFPNREAGLKIPSMHSSLLNRIFWQQPVRSKAL